MTIRTPSSSCENFKEHHGLSQVTRLKNVRRFILSIPQNGVTFHWITEISLLRTKWLGAQCCADALLEKNLLFLFRCMPSYEYIFFIITPICLIVETQLNSHPFLCKRKTIRFFYQQPIKSMAPIPLSIIDLS